MDTTELPGLFWIAAKSFLIALVLTPIVRDIFHAYNVVDRPGRRKVHAYPIPRVGGIPIVIAYSLVLVAVFSSPLLDAQSGIQTLLPGLAVIFFTGLID